MDIFTLLKVAKSSGASDLHLVVSTPPMLRINGELQPLAKEAPLTPDDLELAFNRLSSEQERAEFKESMELDFGYTLADVGRMRVNVARERGTTTLVIRLLPLDIPSLEKMALPAVCKELVVKRRGLVLVTGPTGCGKSTTLAAMIDYLNKTENRRVVTIEDPIEYVYTNRKCTITQRELGSDTKSFAEALKHVLRQDPNLILVGEMRDLETATAALSVAETGHLVMTTGHAPSASQAIERVVDMFPPHERNLVQTRLASLIVGVLCQALVPKIDGSGRVAAIEIMLASPAIRNLIREGKIHQLPNTIRMHAQMGMELLDQALVKLYQGGRISAETLFSFCNDREEAEKLTNVDASPSGSRSSNLAGKAA